MIDPNLLRQRRVARRAMAYLLLGMSLAWVLVLYGNWIQQRQVVEPVMQEHRLEIENLSASAPVTVRLGWDLGRGFQPDLELAQAVAPSDGMRIALVLPDHEFKAIRIRFDGPASSPARFSSIRFRPGSVAPSMELGLDGVDREASAPTGRWLSLTGLPLSALSGNPMAIGRGPDDSFRRDERFRKRHGFTMFLLGATLAVAALMALLQLPAVVAPDGRQSMQPRIVSPWTLAGLALLLALRLVTTSDASPPFVNNPHDASLYVRLAHAMYSDGSFGSYESTTLIKLPGFPASLALFRHLGIPYTLALNLILMALSLLLFLSLRQGGIRDGWALLASFFLLFAPATLSAEWSAVLRESLYSLLVIGHFIAFLGLAFAVRRGRMSRLTAVLFAFTFAWAMVMREEGATLWPLLFCMSLVLAVLLVDRPRSTQLVVFALLAGSPVLLAFGAKSMLSGWVLGKQGVSVIHELSDGEYPKLLSVLRRYGLQQKPDWQVPIPAQALRSAAEASPALRPLLTTYPWSPAFLPARWWKDQPWADEWPYGLQIFWIKDAAFAHYRHRNAKEAQQYFLRARLELERRLPEGPDGKPASSDGLGLLPEWRPAMAPRFLANWMTYVAGFLQPTRAISFNDNAGFRNVDPTSSVLHQVILMAPKEYPSSQVRSHQVLRGAWSRLVITAVPGMLILLVLAAAFGVVQRSRAGAPLTWLALATVALLLIRTAAFGLLAVPMGGLDYRFIQVDLALVFAFAPLACLGLLPSRWVFHDAATSA